MGCGASPAGGQERPPLRICRNDCVGRRALTPPRWRGGYWAAGWGQPALRIIGELVRPGHPGGRPLRKFTRSASIIGRADVGIVPYGRIQRGGDPSVAAEPRQPAHRRASRFPGTVVPVNRGTSSKSPRFICHWQRFADFPLRRGAFGAGFTDWETAAGRRIRWHSAGRKPPSSAGGGRRLHRPCGHRRRSGRRRGGRGLCRK